MSYFEQIYSTLSSTIFGDVLTSSQAFICEQISTWLCLAVLLLPVIVSIGFILRAFRL